MTTPAPAKGATKGGGTPAVPTDGGSIGAAAPATTPASAAATPGAGKGAQVSPTPPHGGGFPPPQWTADLQARAFFLPWTLAEKFENFNTKGTTEDEAFRALDEAWSFLEKEGILQPGKRGNLLPMAGNREQRQALRLALLVGLTLDQVADSYGEVETLSSAGSEGIAEFLKAVRSNRAKDPAGADSAFTGMMLKFYSCLNPDGDLRHAATFANDSGLTEGSPEYSAALKAHIASALEAEKREKVKQSKAELFGIIQSEYPNHIQFLSSSSVEAREQVVQQVAQRHAEISARLEVLKSAKASKASVPGISRVGGAHARFRPEWRKFARHLCEGARTTHERKIHWT